jgi:endonuclease/exonuclease/phosphatase family metal-dependent hydrolase
MRGHVLALVTSAALLTGCASTTNYPDPTGPRYAGVYAKDATPREHALRVVTFNVKFAQHPEGAAALLRDNTRLAGADVILLQEMDEAGTELIARALGVNYVYYPAVVHPSHHQNFGDAILSPWPLTDDVKIVLPHRGRWRKSIRIAVGATVHVAGQEPVRAYSVHLETPAAISGSGRRDQARAILADAAPHPRVIVAGDFNSRGILEVFAAGGYEWLTRKIGPTISRFSWDHVAVKGFRAKDCGSVAAVREVGDVSDHRPVVADVVEAGATAVTATACP